MSRHPMKSQSMNRVSSIVLATIGPQNRPERLACPRRWARPLSLHVDWIGRDVRGVAVMGISGLLHSRNDAGVRAARAELIKTGMPPGTSLGFWHEPRVFTHPRCCDADPSAGRRKQAVNGWTACIRPCSIGSQFCTYRIYVIVSTLLYFRRKKCLQEKFACKYINTPF